MDNGGPGEANTQFRVELHQTTEVEISRGIVEADTTVGTTLPQGNRRPLPQAGGSSKVARIDSLNVEVTTVSKADTAGGKRFLPQAGKTAKKAKETQHGNSGKFR